MKKRLTRHEMTQKDEFVSRVEVAAGWLEHNWRKVGTAAASVAIILLIAVLAAQFMGRRARAADAMLGDVMSLMAAKILPAGELPPLTGETTFNSANERDTAVLASLDELLATYPSSKAAVEGAYLRGAVLLNLGRAEEARTALDSFVKDYGSSELLPAARRAEAEADLQTGHTDEALAILQDLVDNPTVLFPADAALMALARGQETSGLTEKAQETYRRVALEHPDSIYAGDAGQAVARLSAPENSPS